MKIIQKAIVSVLLAWPAATLMGESKGEFKPLPKYPFVYVSSDNKAEIPEISDSLFNASAQGIRFTVNRTELRPEEPFIRTYKEEVVPILKDKGLVLRKIIIRGAASPEGSYENNRRLGTGRTKRLVEFIGSELDNKFSVQDIESASITEDYEYLTVLMREANDAEAEAVSQLWQECKGDERLCKARLQKMNGGKTWARLLKEYFPQLRQARVMLWFGTAPRPKGLTEPLEPTVAQLPEEEAQPLQREPQVEPWVFEPQKENPKLPLIALRTNLLRDAFYMPQFGWAPSLDVQLEYFPLYGHYTYNVGFTWSNHRHWSSQEFFQMRDLQLEVRRYFSEGHPYRGGYLGAYAQGFVYGIGLSKTKGWEGEGGGAGLSIGYTIPLNKRGNWRLELMAAAGFFLTRHDPYVFGNPLTGEEDGDYYYDYMGSASDFKERNHQFTWFGPTNIGLQVTYDIIYRKDKRKGDAR
ncbi:MAG: DUF3575 domain-containing protein [Bacteroidales bacterium]|nr:DUF3575 domain-containing protein [Bacteroidales bacterium]